MKHRILIARLLGQTVLMLGIMAAMLFTAAGEWRWPAAWVFLAEVGALSVAISLWLVRHDPVLLESRLSSPFQPGQQSWDRIFMLVLFAVFMAWLALIGVDAKRLHWSTVPFAVQPVGAVLIAISMLLVWRVFRFNSFAAPQVRIQAERGQKVITQGPYAIVRHPMYAGGLLFFLGMPVMLGSLWGLAGVPILLLAMCFRILGEETMLRHELQGYIEYAERVRFRLFPGIW